MNSNDRLPVDILYLEHASSGILQIELPFFYFFCGFNDTYYYL